MSRIETLSCAIDIEQSSASFHAHAIPDDVGIDAGDVLILHDVPDMADGLDGQTNYTGTRSATLIRAGFLRRNWVKLTSIFELAELFEVGFQPPVSKG